MTAKLYARAYHPNTGSLMNVLAAQGITSPHTGQPYSEAMLLGIGGGLGAGYILWEFKREQYALIVLGFRNRWNYAAEHMQTLCRRLGLVVEVSETAGAKSAAAHLQAALEAGAPLVLWVDKAHLPHQALPESLKGYVSHVVGAHRLKDGAVLVDDLADRLFEVPLDALAAARGRIGSDRNRLLRVTGAGQSDLAGAIRAGIADHIEHLGRDSDSFAIPVYRKWARMMTDGRNKKGWPVVYREPIGLFSTLRSVYEGVLLDGTEGAGLRGLYADFLDEAAGVVNWPGLKEAATAYRKLAAQWTAFGRVALADAAFGAARDLLEQRYAWYRQGRLAELREVSAKLETLQGAMNQDFPLDEAARLALFAEMAAHLESIYTGEQTALAAVKAALPAAGR